MTTDSALFIWVAAGILGGLSYRFGPPLKDWLVARFTTRLIVTSAEEAYYWIIKWIADQSTWASSYQIRMLSHSVKDIRTAATWENERRQATIGPGPGLWWFRFEHRWWWCQLEHRHRENSDRPLETIRVGCLGRRAEALRRLLEAASSHNQVPSGSIRIFRHHGAGWEPPLIRPGRPWATMALSTDALLLLDDAQRFYQSTEWYRARGIPWRRGYLLHGAPGTGKSSLIHALATALNRDIYLISLASLNDTQLERLMWSIPEQVIVAIEDIDIAQPSRRAHATSDSDDGGIANQLGVTLAGLLNSLDGITAPEGRLLICTTNFPDSLDEALVRPGRCDLHVEMPHASTDVARAIQERIAGRTDWDLGFDRLTPAQVQEASIARSTLPAGGLDG